MEEGKQYQAVAPELNYSVENILNSSRKCSKITALSGRTSFDLTANSTQDITFEIPSLPYADSDMYIGFDVEIKAGGGFVDGNFFNAHTTLPCTQIHYGTQQRENEYFSLSNSLQRVQKMTQALTKHSWEDNQPSTRALASVAGQFGNQASNLVAKSDEIKVTANLYDGNDLNVDWENKQPVAPYKQAQRLIQRDHADMKAGGNNPLKFYIRLGDVFPMSIFNNGKVIQRGELGRLRMVFSAQDWCWKSTDIDPTNGAVAIDSDLTISNLALYVNMEKNSEVVRKLNQVISSPDGLSLPIIYPYVNTQNVAQSTQQTTTFDLTSGQGARLLSVQSGLFRAKAGVNDGINHKASDVSSYRIDINNSNIYNFDHTIEQNWEDSKRIWKNTPIVNKRVLADEYSIIQDFTNGQGVMYREDCDTQLDQSKLVGLPMEKTSYLKYGLTANTSNTALEHVHVIYMLRFLNIRESGVQVY